jgi:protocatechuate 3,4-dioxygenase beta subunit
MIDNPNKRKGSHIIALLVILGLTAQIGYSPMMLGAIANPDSPVSGAIMVATSQAGNGSNFTMPNGNYVITQGLKTGIYNVSTIAEGYISQNVGGISVTVGAETGNVNFNLKRSGGISGKVTDSATGSGIANVAVTAFSKGRYGWFGLTDSNGNYKIITNLESGVYNVTVASATGYFTKTISGVSVTAGVETSGVNISLGSSATISGKVTSPSGIPIPGVSVTAISTDGGGYLGSTKTGVDGSYKIESGLGSGTYMVTAFSGTSFNQVQNVEATAGHETPNVNLTLNVTVQPTGAITGTITDTNNNPIAGATISAGSGQATSGSDGVYEISSGIPTGSYTVYVSATGYQPQNKTGVSVTTGSTTSGVNFKLTKIPATQSGRISGTVMGEDNPLTSKQPSSITCIPGQTSINVGDTLSVSGGITPQVAAASVNIEYKMGSTDVTRIATTGSDGKYSDTYSPTAAGSWTVQASWAGDSQHVGASSLAASFTVTQPLTTGGIKITVADSNGMLIVGASVSSTSTPSGQSALSGVSESDGSITFNNITPGSYTFGATIAGYVTNSGTISVSAGSTAMLSITLQPQSTATTSGIKVTVLDSSGKPIVGATVSSTNTPSGQSALSGVSGSDGSITFSSLAVGSYTLQASMSGYVTNSGQATVTAGNVVSSSITLQTQSTGGSSSGGIPGYTFEEIMAGIILSIVVLIWLRRRQ